MKKIILRSVLWFVITYLGGMSILIFAGIKDMSDLHPESLLLGGFIGLMGTYINNIIPDKKG